MKTKEIREKNQEELRIMLKEKQDSLRKARFDMATKQVKNTRELRTIRQDIARILTLLREKDGK